MHKLFFCLVLFCYDTISFSENLYFLNDTQWAYLLNASISKELKNKYYKRQPSYIQTNSFKKLTFAHLQSFHEDSNYACRFPVQFNYLKNFYLDPFPNRDCKINTLVRLSGPEPFLYNIDLDPKRIYEARFMIASKGNDIVSRFGHAMIHLVRCAPNTPFGKDCRKDIKEHVVISYRGQVDELKISFMKGITGKYSLQPFFFLLPKSINEYTGEQDRSLTSYPFKFTRQELDSFVYRLIEDYWVYRTGYNFINRNCATEIEDIVKSVTRNELLVKTQSKQPYSVFENLKKADLVNIHKEDEIYFKSMDKSHPQVQAIRLQSQIFQKRTEVALELKEKNPERANLYEELYEQIQQQFIHSRDALGYGIPLKEEVLEESLHSEKKRQEQKQRLNEVDQDPRVQLLLKQKVNLIK